MAKKNYIKVDLASGLSMTIVDCVRAPSTPGWTVIRGNAGKDLGEITFAVPDRNVNYLIEGESEFPDA